MFDYSLPDYNSQDDFDDREREASKLRTSLEFDGFDKDELDYMSHLWEQD